MARPGSPRRPWPCTCGCWPRRSGATTAGWAQSWTCSRFRPRSAAGWRSGTPWVARSAGRWRTTAGPPMSGPATSSSIARSTLFETSGHLQWYADGMYPPMELEGATYYPKPMNCPGHILIYKSRGRSYRDLPLRLFEFGTVYRYEKSGVLHGLTRARGFTQDDSHIFCTPEQLAGELTSLLAFVIGLLRDFGLTDFEAELATRPERYVGEPAQWAEGEVALRVALEASGLAYVVAAGEGAFYAPKIDVHIRDAIGRRWQLSTLQVDLQEPGRFDMEYQAADNTRRRPYMIHRALFGSVERFFAILLEHYAGALPAWLAPVQVT